MNDWQRSAEEREAARRERERRRAERQGKATAGDPREPRPQPASGPLPAPELQPAVEPEAEPSPEPFPGYDYDDDHADRHTAEAPAGTRRVPGAPRIRLRGERVRRGPGQRAPRRRHSWRGRVGAGIALVLAAALIWFLVMLFQPFHGSPRGSVRVTIPPHSSSGQVGDLLERNGVISSSFFFQLRATLAGDRGDLRSGTYHLQLGMSYGSVLKTLTTAPKAARVTNLTITEGRTRHQINALLRSQGVNGSYLVATRHSRLLDPRRYGAPRSTPSLEGFLFPSTYQLREPIGVTALVDDQLRTFKKEFARVNLGFARSKHLTPYDMLIVASMVEAESATAHDRPLVASVIYNRLHDNMPLQIDATTRYATGNYSRPLTVSELNSPSPYNTRIHKGLTPTPIDNPGLASIRAAANPARTGYLYFVVQPGKCDQAFTSSYQQFLKLQAQYQAARAKRGGRSPSRC